MMRRMILPLFCVLLVVACREADGGGPEPGQWTPFAGVPVLQSQIFDAVVLAAPGSCYGMLPDPFPCPQLRFPDGRVQRLSQGISGYVHTGQETRIRVEQVTLDTSHPQFPADAAGVVYRQIDTP